MKYQGINKYEYKYIKLGISIERSIDILNIEGFDGWELIKLFDPLVGGDNFKGLMKRQILELNV